MTREINTDKMNFELNQKNKLALAKIHCSFSSNLVIKIELGDKAKVIKR